MNQEKHFHFSNGVIGYPLVFVLIIWIVFWFEVRFGFRFNQFGIYPRTLTGLKGVFFSPFVHGDIQHLYHNTIPLFILSTSVFYFYRHIAWKVLLYGVLISGFLTWCIGRPSYHIGISGLIYVLASFIFFKGIFAKHFRLIALSLLIVFLYGSMVWYVFPVKEGMSWEGHLSGLITGFIFSLIFKRQIVKPKKYAWEMEDYDESEDEFLKHFDENGNFIEHKEGKEIEEKPKSIRIKYFIKPKDKD